MGLCNVDGVMSEKDEEEPWNSPEREMTRTGPLLAPSLSRKQGSRHQKTSTHHQNVLQLHL
jgi:hypothetical protein